MRNTTITKVVVAGMLAAAMTTTVFTGAQTSVHAEEQQQMTTNDEIDLLEAKKAAMEADMAVYPNCKGLADAHDKVTSDIEEMKQYKNASKKAPSKNNFLTAGVTAALGSSDMYDGKINSIYEADKDIAERSFYGYYNIDAQRMQAVNTAVSSQGRIRYVWGGKPSSPDWQTSWDEKTSGLDCSGFISFVYWNTTGVHNEGFESTYAITRHASPISEDELQPGDLGMLNDRGTYWTAGNTAYDTREAADAAAAQSGEAVRQHTGHVGIYVGLDADGNKLFCHCKGGSTRTVVVDNFNFRYFYRMF